MSIFAIVSSTTLVAILTACSLTSEPKKDGGIDGKFISPMLQHPIMHNNQSYFRPDGEEHKYSEWITVTKRRPPIGIPVTIYGKDESINLGGRKGTKESYGNRVIFVDRIEKR